MSNILTIYDFIDCVNDHDSLYADIVIYADNTSYIIDTIRPIIYKNNSRLRMKLVNTYMTFFNENKDVIDEIINECNNKINNKRIDIHILTQYSNKYKNICNKYKNVKEISSLDLNSILENNNYLFVLDTQYNNNIHNIHNKKTNVVLLRTI